MNVSDFYASVRGALQRGTSQDAMIPLWASEACSLIEQEWTYQWMRRTGVTAVDAQAMVPNQVAFPNARVKSFDFVKILNPTLVQGLPFTGQDELLGVDPKDVTGIGIGCPQAYWLDGVSYLYLDENPPVDIDLFMSWMEFTDWPTDGDAEPAILIRARSLLQNTTMVVASRDLKDPRMMEQYASFAQTSRAAARSADVELANKHQGYQRMEYVPAGG